MKNLVRGGVILSILSLFAVMFYAQTRTETAPKANDSQQKLNNNIEDTKIDTKIDDKKLVKKTASERKVTAGASRGSFTATAYCLRGRTAMGHGVRAGLIAADPRVLRLGSRINLGAGAYSGNYLVSDTGGKIKGRRLDIWMASCSEARRFGRRNVTVGLLGQ
jgi:3D (Asp-Asp-Asp) domain-containing protein